jgi:hypothetical protein
MRNVWLLGPQPFSEWGETVRQIRVEAGAPLDGKKRKASPDCPLHADRSVQASSARDDGHGAVLSSRNGHSDSRPAREHQVGFVPIALHRARMIEQQSSDLPLLSCSPSATDHSSESRRTGLAPETNRPCSVSAQIGRRNSDSEAIPNPADSVERTPENNISSDPGLEAASRNADSPSEPLECTCEWYIEKTEKTSHFATFPTEIPRRAILAGTSARGVCPKCGGPWVRVVEKTAVGDWRSSERSRDLQDGAKGGPSGTMPGYKPPQTIGWRPSCECIDWDRGNYDGVFDHFAPIHATVLDPFLGAGTTALVADQLGRHCIGIELSAQYVIIAEKRLRDDAGMFLQMAAQ